MTALSTDTWRHQFRIPADPASLALAQKRLLALNMKAAGLPWDTIGELLGETPKAVCMMVNKDLQKVSRVLANRAKELHALEWQRLEYLTTALWPAAMGGNARAVEVLLKTMERRAKMMGFDAPERIETKNQTLTMDFSGLTDAELSAQAHLLGLNADSRVPAAAFLPGVSSPESYDTEDAEVAAVESVTANETVEMPEGDATDDDQGRSAEAAGPVPGQPEPDADAVR